MTKRITVVTGVSSGIGATACRLAAERFEVMCASCRTECIEELATDAVDQRRIFAVKIIGVQQTIRALLSAFIADESVAIDVES